MITAKHMNWLLLWLLLLSWIFFLGVALEVKLQLNDQIEWLTARMERAESSVLPSVIVKSPRTTIYGGGSQIVIDDNERR